MSTRRDRRPTERDLVALADGSLPAARRARVERAVAASRELQAILAAQRSVLAAIHDAAGEPAPAAMRARLELVRDPRQPRRVGSRPVLTLGSAALAAAVLSIVAMLALGGGSLGAPSAADAALLATRPPLAPTPAPKSDSVALLPRLRAAGLPYPYWEDRFGFKAVGVRRDRLAGRLATTVFYSRAGQRIAYTIVSGPPLRSGAATRTTASDGTRLRSFRAHGRRIVTWLRRAQTCVLSGADIPLSALLRLAAWRRGGEIPY
jgi:hypothetical protein